MNEYDKLGRPNWDNYFLSLTFVIAQRSIDPNTKHGAVLVSKNKKILATGYNGPIKNIPDNKIPLTRPEKYYYIIHSEENCLLSYNGDEDSLKGSTMYITGEPCHRCLRMIIQKGIKNIVYGPLGSACLDEGDEKFKHFILSNHDIKMKKIENLDSLVSICTNVQTKVEEINK